MIGGSLRGRATLVLVASVAAFALIVGFALAAGEAADPLSTEVKAGVDTSERGGAVSSGIPISSSLSKALNNSKVVYSVHAPGLDPGETLHFDVSPHVSRCNEADTRPGNRAGQGALHSPCEDMNHVNRPVGTTYPYNPNVEARLYRASSPTVTGHNSGSAVIADVTDICSQFQHHCPLQLQARRSDLAANASKEYLNIEVFAWTGSGKRDPDDVVELSGDCAETVPGAGGDYDPPGPDVCDPLPLDEADAQKPLEETKGQLGLVRRGPSHPAPVVTMSQNINQQLIEIDDGQNGAQPEVVYTRAVQHLDPGDVIRVDTDNLHVKDDPNNGNYQFDHAVHSWWILTDAARNTRPTSRWISPQNNKNCRYNGGDGCVIRQLGSVTVPPGVGSNSTMRVNLVVRATDTAARGLGQKNAKVATAPPNDPTFIIRCYSASPGGSACNS
jgi:hypothetical protein